MKQLVKRILVLVFALTMLCIGTALADRYSSIYTDTPPAEVLTHVQSAFAGYELEDYISITGTPKGDYGFALLYSNNKRILAAYHKEGTQMEYWLSNSDAVPQSDGYVYFQRHSAGMYISVGNTNATYSNSLGFDVVRIDKSAADYWAQSVSYHWESGTFQLYAFMDRTAGMERAYVTNSGVSYYNFSTGKKLGRVEGTLQRNFRYLSFKAAPKTYAQAKKKLTVAPEIPDGELSAVSIKFTGAKKYAVYSAPSTEALRGNNGKATVSTNDWIQVFGEENGYILIQYAISKDQMRFGYIKASSLPKNTTVQTLVWRNTTSYVSTDVSLTDDPLNSQKTLLNLAAGEQVTLLGTMGDWAYVETTNGSWARGFVPQSVLTQSTTLDLASYSASQVTGTMTIGSDNKVTINMAVQTGTVPAYFLMLDENDVQLGMVSKVQEVVGTYQMQGYLPTGTCYVRFIPVSSDGTKGEELFSVVW
jgi:hypothetical protein